LRQAILHESAKSFESARAASLTHDNLGLGDARGNALVRQDRRAVDVQLVFDRDVVSQDRDVLQTRLRNQYRPYTVICGASPPTHPSADVAVPPNDRVGHPRVVPDSRVGQDHGSLQTDTGADLGSRANDDVGANDGGGVDLGGLP